jgi:hypothetical protein
MLLKDFTPYGLPDKLISDVVVECKPKLFQTFFQLGYEL